MISRERSVKMDINPTGVHSATHLIAVDGSEEADAAFHWAHDMYPSEDTFVIAHGMFLSAVCYS